MYDILGEDFGEDAFGETGDLDERGDKVEAEDEPIECSASAGKELPAVAAATTAAAVVVGLLLVPPTDEVVDDDIPDGDIPVVPVDATTLVPSAPVAGADLMILEFFFFPLGVRRRFLLHVTI